MTRILSLVILTSSLLSWTAAGTSVRCTWTKVLPNRESHLTFLRRGSASAPPRLYHTVWSRERALLGCAWSEDAPLVRSYADLCAERARDFSDRPDGSYHLDSVLGADEQRCVPLDGQGGRAGNRAARSAPAPREAEDGRGQGERSEVRSRTRVKRGFIVPGTLWCGSGNKALSYSDLGVFADTDSCCREHDQCKHTILSFHSDFGVFNTNIFTMSHCDCDTKFRSCLKEANDRIASVVGYTFFNLLKMHCFQFAHRLQCTQRNWFGMCKETKMALYAEVHPPTLFESDNPEEMNGTASVFNSTSPAELPSDLFSVAAAASTLPAPSTRSPSVAPVTNDTAGSEPERRDEPENTVKNRTAPEPEPDAGLTEMQLSCAIYKDLDGCRNKIRPQQSRYGLHNPEPRTLYHCNCTSRLFQTLVKQRRLTEVQSLLLGHVSRSCFLPQDCTTGKTCTAVLVKADLPQLERRSGAEVEEQRHLQAVKLKVRRPSDRRAERKDRAVRLHKLCLRMTRPKRTMKTREHGQKAQQ